MAAVVVVVIVVVVVVVMRYKVVMQYVNCQHGINENTSRELTLKVWWDALHAY